MVWTAGRSAIATQEVTARASEPSECASFPWELTQNVEVVYEATNQDRRASLPGQGTVQIRV